MESPYFVPSVELDCGRAADLHLHQDGDTVWVVLFDVTEQRDATRRLQQKAYDMTLLQEKEAAAQSTPGGHEPGARGLQ